MNYIKEFNSLNKTDVSIAGGKGASLGEMTQLGIPVPQGFVILSNAFEKFIEITDINVEIDAILDKVNIQEMHTVENASEEIQALILNEAIPKEIKKEIIESHKKLNCEFVAVRSSATSEDSASAAWAGQLESFLNTTKETLLENVRKCWASLFTPRAIFYRFEQKLHKSKISVAVVVQKMVESEKSGIAFSVHPVTQDYNQLIIEAGLGLGEAIVSGQITPDSYVVDKQDNHIIDINVSEQKKALYRKKGGGNEWKDLGEGGGKQVLSEKEIIELADLIIKIEKHYGFPVDIEWAYEKGRFYIVQSRPITTLGKKEGGDIEAKYLILKEYSFRKIVSFPRVPVIYLYAFKSFIDNPFLKKIPNWKTNTICVMDDSYEAWQDYSKKTIIKDKKTILALINHARECIKKYKPELNKIIDSKRDYSNQQLLNIYHRLNEIYLDVYYSNILFNDECFETDDLELIRELPLIRAQISDILVTPLWSSFDKIIKNCSKNSEIPVTVLERLTWDEINSVLDGKILEDSKFENREIGFIVIDNTLNLVFGNDAKKIKEYLHNNDPEKDDIELAKNKGILKGVTANKGKIKGRVVLLLGKDYPRASEILEGKKDYILVTPMTRPEISRYFKDALGFIADEGGITSHLSIVARELNKPAIMGTHFATQVLHDGDLVEVDADNGVIRILKKSKD